MPSRREVKHKYQSESSCEDSLFVDQVNLLSISVSRSPSAIMQLSNSVVLIIALATATVQATCYSEGPSWYGYEEETKQHLKNMCNVSSIMWLRYDLSHSGPDRISNFVWKSQ